MVGWMVAAWKIVERKGKEKSKKGSGSGVERDWMSVRFKEQEGARAKHKQPHKNGVKQSK